MVPHRSWEQNKYDSLFPTRDLHLSNILVISDDMGADELNTYNFRFTTYLQYSSKEWWLRDRSWFISDDKKCAEHLINKKIVTQSQQRSWLYNCSHKICERIYKIYNWDFLGIAIHYIYVFQTKLLCSWRLQSLVICKQVYRSCKVKQILKMDDGTGSAATGIGWHTKFNSKLNV